MDYARLLDDGSMIALGLVLLLMSRRKATKSVDSDLVDSDLKKAEKLAKRRASYRAVGLLLIAFGLVKTFYISPPWVANSSSLRSRKASRRLTVPYRWHARGAGISHRNSERRLRPEQACQPDRRPF